MLSIGPLWQEKQPAPRPPPVAGVKNSLAPRSWGSVSARSSPARNRSKGVFRVTVVRRKVAVALKDSLVVDREKARMQNKAWLFSWSGSDLVGRTRWSLVQERIHALKKIPEARRGLGKKFRRI